MDKQATNLVFLGPPGAGKGTQAQMAARELGIAHIATGDLLRDEISRGSALGRRAETYMGDGRLVPDDLMIEMVRERLGADDARAGFLLDGFPRTVAQADALAAMLDGMGRALDLVISLELDDGEIVRRISGRLTCRGCGAVYHVQSRPPRRAGVCDLCGGELYQRPDDHEEPVQTRLRAYRQQTAPLLAYYAQRSLLRRVDGAGSIEDVRAQILETIRGAG